MSKEKLENMIKAYREIADHLETAKGKSPEEVNDALHAASSASVCCNACQAVSSICVPSSTPDKCKGGCTVTSYVF